MKYFTIEELCKSEAAKARGIDNTPSNQAVENLWQLVENVLDPLREAIGKPIKVNSGYRSEKLNKAVGGAKNSDHLKGCAADITIGAPKENKLLFTTIRNLGLPYRQLIWEKGGKWVHVSFIEGENKRQIIYA